jgi:hypothetical protein
MWRTRILPRQRSLILWDVDRQTLTRVHIQSEGGTPVSMWEQWSGVSREAIDAEDLDDGFDFGSYRDGRGSASLPAAAQAFVQRYAPGVFTAAY